MNDKLTRPARETRRNVTIHLTGGLPLGSSKDLDTAKAEFKPQAPDDEPRRGSVLRYLAASARSIRGRGSGCIDRRGRGGHFRDLGEDLKSRSIVGVKRIHSALTPTASKLAAPGSQHQNGKGEQEIGPTSQVGTGGFVYQDGAASFTPKTAVLPFGPVTRRGSFLAGSVEQARQREPAGSQRRGSRGG